MLRGGMAFLRCGVRCGDAAWRNAKCGVLSAWAHFSAWRAHFSLALAVAWPIVIGETWPACLGPPQLTQGADR
jgi:hypothetical protein